MRRDDTIDSDDSTWGKDNKQSKNINDSVCLFVTGG